MLKISSNKQERNWKYLVILMKQEENEEKQVHYHSNSNNNNNNRKIMRQNQKIVFLKKNTYVQHFQKLLGKAFSDSMNKRKSIIIFFPLSFFLSSF